MKSIELVCFDMAGTTVRDHGEVGDCFEAAARETGLLVERSRIQAQMGRSKRVVFETLWAEELGRENPELTARVDTSYAAFRRILEHHYQTTVVEPSEGCLECFSWLASSGVLMCLTTGFYRQVTNIILGRLGWQGMICVTSDEVPKGRPAPYLIHRGMALTGAEDIRKVVAIGDTPADLAAGKNAGCGWTLGITSGSHTREQLATHPNDGLIHTLAELKDFFES
jgi:phosphonatase-like hydrolase